MNNITDKINLMLQKEKYKQILTFTTIGIINTLVDISLSFVLHGFFGVNYLICQISGYSAGTLNSFFLNKFFTFKNTENRQKSIYQFFRFITLNIVSLGVTLPVLHLLINGLLFNFYISKIFVTILSLSLNFIGSKFWVFKKNSVGM